MNVIGDPGRTNCRLRTITVPIYLNLDIRLEPRAFGWCTLLIDAYACLMPSNKVPAPSVNRIEGPLGTTIGGTLQLIEVNIIEQARRSTSPAAVPPAGN
jgi:hypothetical protein